MLQILNITMKQVETVDLARQKSGGWINGAIGVLLFSGSLPATRIAVLEMDPFFLTAARAAIAGILSICILIAYKERRPTKTEMQSLLIVAMGVVVGFPLLTGLALQYITSAHSLVFMGLLPMSTAIFGVIRGKEKPALIFWLFSFLGSALVVGYAISQGIGGSPIGDILMLAAIILCGLGYAEGAKLSKTLGGVQVISWALVISLPLSIPTLLLLFPPSLSTISVDAWISLMYVAFICMYIAFIFWYRGLAMGGIATVGQLQLLQPFLGLGLAAFLLHEHVSIGMLGITCGVILCVAATKRFAK